MLKKQRQIQDFQDTFAFLKGQSVIFYGTGQYTELLLRAPLAFRVIGLMDQNKTGTVCCGLPVLSEEEAGRSGCKTIILIANLSSAPLIYRRIRAFAREYGITVYCMNGRNPGEDAVEIVPPSQWAQSYEALLERAMGYDVVSFDLFDTLIARKCLLPEAVFSIVERRARQLGIPLEDFPARRREAEKALYHGGQPWYTLESVCAWLGEAYRLPPDTADRLKALELETELELIRPRDDMVYCYQELRKRGKRTVITSDMYLTGAQLAPLLQKCGIGEAELYLSNERGASKHLGTLFQTLRDAFPGARILHIGDNPRCDVENAEKNGVDAALVPSAAAWMGASGLDGLKESGAAQHALFAQRCFSSPFVLAPDRRRILVSGAEDVGYLFFGPLAAGYLAWLVKQVREREITRLLFISRDGYLFHRLYQRVQALYGALPRADYFLTSRRCAGVASLKTAEDVRFLLDDVCQNRDMPFGRMLERIYGLSAGPDESAAKRTLGELGGERVWELLQDRYLERILSHAAEERAHYLRYIDSLDLRGERIGMMNLVGRGVTQRCLQSVLGQTVEGFYLALEYDSGHILGGTGASAWYPEMLSTHTGKRKLAEQLLLGETVFSAPHGAVAVFSEGGEPVYEETRARRAAFVTACQRGIAEYLEDILRLSGGLEALRNTADAADRIFGLLCDGRFLLPDDVKAGFCFEDRFQ